ncbi:hypothetical protein HPB48_009607 [Haemaphysalis longicornis]|uniref:Phospholipid scramblase n=1 Tax=Haemaphysalis longicornis TaxID=44386 RepID=A0A9J6FUG7_HAELO|nr:hypothetical protein HPB48_009607 [Haemaphysalis longicornis]
MDIYAPAGTLIGSVKMDCSIIFPVFTIQDASKKRVLKIKGPFCTQSTCCGDVVFDIFTADGVTKIGLMNKNFGGVLREHLTDADNFTVVFPMDLDVKMKAVLLGALILIVSVILFLNTNFTGIEEPCPQFSDVTPFS